MNTNELELLELLLIKLDTACYDEFRKSVGDVTEGMLENKLRDRISHLKAVRILALEFKNQLGD